MIKNIVFDFDGTLADTLDLALRFGNENQTRFAKRKITREEFRERSMREVLKHLDLPWYKLPQFVLELKRHMKENIHQVSLFPFIPGLIESLKNENFNLYVLSSNSEENIANTLAKANVLPYFKEIASDSSIFGKHVVLERLFKKCDLHSNDTIYIGDEVRDAEACKKFGISMIAVAWGWDSVSRLRQFDKLTVVETVEELTQTLTQLVLNTKNT